ncbi:MAG: hypothetical protein J6D03_00550 [Clostridia bacterium]|nr:hypothetical protein [Clostridia bacterium]
MIHIQEFLVNKKITNKIDSNSIYNKIVYDLELENEDKNVLIFLQNWIDNNDVTNIEYKVFNYTSLGDVKLNNAVKRNMIGIFDKIKINNLKKFELDYIFGLGSMDHQIDFSKGKLLYNKKYFEYLLEYEISYGNKIYSTMISICKK